MIIAALDVGRRRIGVAVTDDARMGAHPVGAVQRTSFARDIEALNAMLAGRALSMIVVGLPLNMDGSEGSAARSARTYAARVAEAMKIEVEMFDERLTSFEAEERLKGMPVKRAARKPAIDAIAATVILEGWLKAQEEKSGGTGSR